MDDREHIDAAIEGIVEQIRSYRSEIERLDACIDDLKTELRDLLEARGESWTDAEGYARVVSDGARTHYKADSLDELIITDPLRYGWLRDYRITSTVQGRVQVK
ncbi:MAG: hypothetical protein IPK19_01010 [Chloroflexi bacterium]|nr:hypothetical protein [Chloroflexota bacterium]